VPLRAYIAAQQVKAGADLGAAAQEAAIGIATDVAIGAVLFGVLRYAPRLFQIRLAGQGVRRAASSVWNLDKFERGREIEQLILGRPGTNMAVVEEVTEGVAVSVKSIDLTTRSYQSSSGLWSELAGHARDLASYTFNLPPGPGIQVTERVLIVAIEDGAATAAQTQVLTQFGRMAHYVWPNIKIIFTAIP
jgi:hypothetical protein